MSGVKMSAVSQGVAVTLSHGPSGTQIATVPPVDNGGTGESFSPTDLLAASLAACALTTLALVAGRENLPWGDARAEVEKIMTPPPRRVGELRLTLQMPSGLPRQHRARYEEIAHHCPVALSLSKETQVHMTFVWPE